MCLLGYSSFVRLSPFTECPTPGISYPRCAGQGSQCRYPIDQSTLARDIRILVECVAPCLDPRAMCIGRTGRSCSVSLNKYCIDHSLPVKTTCTLPPRLLLLPFSPVQDALVAAIVGPRSGLGDPGVYIDVHLDARGRVSARRPRARCGACQEA